MMPASKDELQGQDGQTTDLPHHTPSFSYYMLEYNSPRHSAGLPQGHRKRDTAEVLSAFYLKL